MKTFEEFKGEMQESIKKLIDEVLIYIPETIQKRYAEDLYEDLENEFYTVVILGEFKRGKSTFVNALLGENILPVDVTPTTASINAMLWDEERYMSVYNTDGKIDKMELKNKYLKKYVAGAEFDPNTIQYIKIGLPADILKNNVVLVDTPGVDDLNQQRVDVTYKFIPRADAVLFLLDATSPVRRTEKEFIEENLVNSGIGKIIFIANFFDQLDEEESEDAIEDISIRLRNALGGREVQLFGISARQALDARISEDKVLLEQSGILKVEEAISNLVESGCQTEENINRYHKRFIMILDAIEREFKTLIRVEASSILELNSELQNISKMIKEEERRKMALDEYVRRQEKEMLAIVRKSVNYFEEHLREDLLEAVDNCKSAEFKELMEKVIPKRVKSNINGWLQQNMGSITKMFEMLEKELAMGLAKHFNTSINKLNVNKGINEIDNRDKYSIQIEAEDISKTPLMAGMIAAATSGILMLIAGPIFIGFVGMAGLPFIHKKLLDGKLAEAKNKLKPELNIAIDKVMESFSMGLEKLVLNKNQEIKNACSVTYDQILNSIVLKIQKQIDEKQNLRTNSKDRINNFNKSIDNINNYKELINIEVL